MMKNMYKLKGCGAKRLIKEFPLKTGNYDLWKNCWKAKRRWNDWNDQPVTRKRPHSARTASNITILSATWFWVRKMRHKSSHYSSNPQRYKHLSDFCDVHHLRQLIVEVPEKESWPGADCRQLHSSFAAAAKVLDGRGSLSLCHCIQH